MFARVEGSHLALSPELRPEAKAAWPLDAIVLPRDAARIYGDRRRLSAFSLSAPRGAVPLVVHPTPPRDLARVRDRYGARATGLYAEATASYRTVLASGPSAAPVCLKLSLGAVLAGMERRLTEEEIARGVLVSRLLEAVPAVHRRALGLGFFRESVGVVEADSGEGFLVRELPALRSGSWLLPAFSLGAARPGGAPPWIVEWIRRAGVTPERFVIDRIVSPYAGVVSYLLLQQGIEIEGHGQNVLFEVSARGLSGKIYLRDLSDASVNLPLRVAKGKPLPRLPRGCLPSNMPFAAASALLGLLDEGPSARRRRARDTIENYGLLGFLWPIHQAVRRYFPEYDAGSVDRAYLHRFQYAALRYLGVRPLLRPDRPGLAMDEAILHFVVRSDLGSPEPKRARARSSSRSLRLPGPLLNTEGRRKRVPTHWGDLILVDKRPVFFEPAF